MLTKAAYIDRVDNSTMKHLKLITGIIDTQEANTFVGMINETSEEVTVSDGQGLGYCHSIIEDIHSPNSEERCASVSSSTKPTGTENLLPDHLQEMYDKSRIHLNETETQKFKALLIKYQDVFAKSSDNLGRTNKVKHTINTGNSNPIRQPPRRQPYGKREVEKQEVEHMLEKGIIEPSNSPWSSPIVLVTKKDGSARFCVDYRRLNDVTVKDAYPIPRVDDCFDALSGSKWFSCMDLCSGFWQIEMDGEDKMKTAFSTNQGLFHFRVMPFGLVNAPSTFQRLMEDVLRGLQWRESLLYMDDIITPGKTVDECLERLEHVFQRLRSANLKLKPSKCIFFQRSVTFLGHVVTEDGVRTDPEKIKTVKEWPTPETSKQVRSFIGLASYYRRFVKGFTDIARPLHKLCEKNNKFRWTEECQQVFDRLKEALTTTPILAYPKIGSKFIVDSDASDLTVGAVLSQEQDGEEKVIAYMSKSMNVHERAYCITRKELLAVVTALRHYHNYLYGQEVLLRTDNAAVSWMKTLKTPTGQVARWLQELSTYNLVVVHRAGKSHANADALSRIPCKSCTHQQKLQENYTCENTVEDESSDANQVRVVTRSKAKDEISSEMTSNQVLLNGWDPIEISTKQAEDSYIGPTKIALSSGKQRPNWAEISGAKSENKTLWRQWDRLEIKGGLLYRLFETDDGDVLHQLVTPEKLQNEVITYHHDIASAGHLGVEKTLGRIRQAFYWPGMAESVRKYCKACDVCTAHNLSRNANKAPLGQYIVGEPMERVMMDILGPMPVTNIGNKYILVISDWFTKWTESIAIPDIESKTVAKAIVDNFVCRFGAPLQIYSDQGRCFESKLMEDLCDLLSIEKTHSSSMRPQANGLVERFNRTLISMLKAYCQSNQADWDIFLQQVMMAYRSSIHSSTKITPNKMVLGREVVLPMHAVIGSPKVTPAGNGHDDYVTKLQNKLQQCHDLARKNLKVAAKYQKKYYDSKSKITSFSQGQLVWLHDPTRKVGISSKLVNKWKGPFVVTRKLDDLVCMVKRTKSGKSKAYHVDRLYPYNGNKIPRWILKETY